MINKMHTPTWWLIKSDCDVQLMKGV